MASSPPRLTRFQWEVLEAFFERERGFFLTGGGANKLNTIASRCEVRDLVDVMILERSGFRVEDALEGALLKDGGCTPATLAWVLSQVIIPDDAAVPGGISGTELRAYVEQLIHRLRKAAFPEFVSRQE